MWVVLDRNQMVQVKCIYTILSMKMVYKHDIKWQQMHRPTHASRMPGRLISAGSAKLQCCHRSWFCVAHVLPLSGAGWSWLPWDMLPVMSNMAIPNGSKSVGSLSTDGARVEGFSLAQPLPLVCHPQPTLSWDWWVASSFYAGSDCTPPHPWGIPHRLIHWDRATTYSLFPYWFCILWWPLKAVTWTRTVSPSSKAAALLHLS